MSLLNRFIEHVRKENLFQKNERLVLAVSGGVDSVVLCALCKQAAFHFEIAHCNFQLRGGESDRDENFVRSLGDTYQTHVFVKKHDTKKFAEENKLSIQVAARELRYGWFAELVGGGKDTRYQVSGIHTSKSETDFQPAKANLEPSTLNLEPSTLNLELPSSTLNSFSRLLTAHHANDNIETLLMNFFKGTGIKGLQGIPAKHETLRWIVRPLLFARREEIVDFATENNLSFVEDSSNASDNYTRNYFRHHVSPAIQKVFPQAEDNLISNIERFKEVDILYRQAVVLHKKKLIEHRGNEIHIPVIKLLKSEPLKTIIYEIIKEYGFTPHQASEVEGLLQSESGKYLASASHKIIKNRKWIIIAPHNNMESSLVVINDADKQVEFENGQLTFIHRTNNTKPDFKKANDLATVDAAGIIFPLILRKWKQGDYFYPLGMQKKKKLSRFFSDNKMSLAEKEKSWVIESNKKIVWVVNKRIDDRFKISGHTKEILTIQFTAY